jgi:hypothetical protein
VDKTRLTCQLLHHLHAGSQEGAAQITIAFAQGPLEASHPRADVARLRDDLHFVLVVGHDLGQLVLDVVRIDRLAPHEGQVLRGGRDLAFHNVETGRLGCWG